MGSVIFLGKVKDFINGLSTSLKIIYLVLLVGSLSFFILSLQHDFLNLSFDLALYSDLFSFACTLIVLGYLLTHMSFFRNLIGSETKKEEEDDGKRSSSRELFYLLILGLLSMTSSLFHETSTWASLWDPYLDMFKILSAIILLTFVATKLPSFKEIYRGKISARNQIVMLLAFSLLGILASYFVVYSDGVPVNVRNLVISIAGFFGGPIVGIGSGLIAGVWRFTMGGVTALPCAVVTIIAGVFSSVVYWTNNNRFVGLMKASLYMLLFEGFDMLIVLLMSPGATGYAITNRVYLPMLFGGVMGMIIFSMILAESQDDIDVERDDHHVH